MTSLHPERATSVNSRLSTALYQVQGVWVPLGRELRRLMSTTPASHDALLSVASDSMSRERSPRAGAMRVATLRAAMEGKFFTGRLGYQLWGQLGDQLGSQLRAQLMNQLGAQLRAQLWDRLRGRLVGRLWDQLRGQLGREFDSGIDSGINSGVDPGGS